MSARGGPKTFNKFAAVGTATNDVLDRMYSSLLYFDSQTQQLSPDLAHVWEVTRDSRTYTFHLRRGLHFSDGSPLTADDVAFAMRVIYDPRVHPGIADLLLLHGRPVQVETPDSATVVFRLPEPYAQFLDVLSTVYILPRARLGPALAAGSLESEYSISESPGKVVGSGPFRLRSFQPGERVILERNPYYHWRDAKGQRLPYLDELVFELSSDQNAEILRFEQGVTDAMDVPRSSDYSRLAGAQKSGKFTLHDFGPDLRTNFFCLNQNLKPDGHTPCVAPEKYAWFSNPQFRRALSYAVNQKKIIRLALQGQARENWGPTTEANTRWHSSRLHTYPYNPVRARELLQTEGFRDVDGDGWLEDRSGHRVSFTMMTNADNTTRLLIATLLKSDFKRVGVDLVVAPIDNGLLSSRLSESHDFEAVLLGFAPGVPLDPALGQNVWRSSGRLHLWHAEQAKPGTAWESEVDSLLDRMSGARAYGDRKRMWDRVQDLVSDACVLQYLPTERAYCVTRNSFGNLSPSVLPNRVLWNCQEIYRKP